MSFQTLKSSLNRYSWRSFHPQAKLLYIRDVEQANIHVASMQSPVGFDLEWKPTFTKATPENPVSLVQLANKDTILLIQISAMPTFPPKLREFLESPDFVKAGVGIQHDVKKLYNDCKVSTRSCVDLSLLARSVDNARWKGKYSNPLGLARLIEAYENLLLPKGKTTRSNWENVLNPQQIEYAGNDAHAGFVIYERLIAMTHSMEKVPKQIYYTFDAVRGRLCEPSGMHWSSYNPDYDPGPPPEPKLPNPPAVTDTTTPVISRLTAQPEPGILPAPVIVSISANSDGSFTKPSPRPPRFFSSQSGISRFSSSSNLHHIMYPHSRRHYTLENSTPPNQSTFLPSNFVVGCDATLPTTEKPEITKSTQEGASKRSRPPRRQRRHPKRDQGST